MNNSLELPPRWPEDVFGIIFVMFPGNSRIITKIIQARFPPDLDGKPRKT